MTDLTDSQRVELARQAQLALDNFLAPALAAVEAYYFEEMVRVAGSTNPRAPQIQERLGVAVKVCREVAHRIEAFVHDGAMAKSQMIHAAKREEMTPAQRRLVNIGAN